MVDPQPAAPFDDPVEITEARGRRVFKLEHGTNTERVVFFSDAVFAIAVTLLVLDIRLPEGTTDANLTERVVELVPKLGAFAISFVLVVGAWLAHFRRFRLVHRYDPALIRINLVLMFLICLVPFPTAVFSEHAVPVATAMYGGCLGLIFIVQAWALRSAYRRGLLDPRVDDAWCRARVAEMLWIGIPFVSAIALAWISQPLAYAVWLVGGGRSLVLLIRRRAVRRQPSAG